MKRRVQIATLLTFILLVVSNSIVAKEDPAFEFAARSASIEKLYQLSDLLHILTFNASTDDNIDSRRIGADLLTEEGGRFTLEGQNGYRDVAGPDFLSQFASRYEPLSTLLPPFFYSELTFSQIEREKGNEVIEISGLLSITGKMNGRSIDEPQPFYAVFVLDKSSTLKCQLNEFKSGAGVRPRFPISYNEFTPRQFESFSDLHSSPLIDRGYCSKHNLLLTCERMSIHTERKKADFEERQDFGTSKRDAHVRRRETEAQSLELMWTLPFFLPPDSWNSNERTTYKGEPSISALIDQFEVNRSAIPAQVQLILNDHGEQKNNMRIQALMVRAWHYLIDDGLSSPLLFHRDIDKARAYPCISAIEVIDVFGRSALGDEAKARESMRRINAAGPSTVLRHYLHRSMGEEWLFYGLQMKRYHEYRSALNGLFLGSRFVPSADGLQTLATMAGRMGEHELAVDCLWSMITIQEGKADADTWSELALQEARSAIDPSAELQTVERLENGRGARHYQVMSLFHHHSGRADKANKFLAEGEAIYSEDPLLLSARAEISSDPMKRRKLRHRLVDLSPGDESWSMFKHGIIDHQSADEKDKLTEPKRRELYKNAIYHYLDAVNHGFDKGLAFSKVADAYVSLDDPHQATYYYQRAITDQEHDVSVYFAQSLLDLCTADMDGFASNLHHAEKRGIEKEGNERDKALLRFMKNLDDLDVLTNLVNSDDELSEKDRLRADELSTIIGDRVSEMYLRLTPQDSAYGGFSRVMLESLSGYLQRDAEGGGFRYRDNNIQDEGVLDMMKRNSDVPLNFLRDLPMMNTLSNWNREFGKKILNKMPRSDRKRGLNYLKRSATFTDPYNYL